MDTPSTSASFNTVHTSRKNFCLEEPLTTRPVDHYLITWTINDFLKLSHFTEKSISSPPIQSSSTDSWIIVVFPYFLFTRENNVQFCLLRNASKDKSTVEVTYRFGVKKSEVTWFEEKFKVSFSCYGSALELYDIVEYFGSENALKENTLTVLCEMYITCNQHFDKLSPEKMSGWAVDLLQLSSDLFNLSKKPETADAKISLKSEDIPVHKAILAARSTVFAQMLLDNCSCINIPEDDIDHVRNILIYIYSANFYLITTVNGIHIGFYESAKRYKVNGLIDILTPVEMNVSSSMKEKSINFKWKMEKFSSFNIKYNECITSPPFHIGSKDEPVWHLDIYPAGSHRAPDSVGIFLRSKDMNKVLDMHIHISILDEFGHEHCTKYTDKLLYPNFFYGFPQYISKRELDEADYLRGDKLIIYCKIKSLYWIETYDKVTSVLWPLCEEFACFEQLSEDMEKILSVEEFSDTILMVSDNAVFPVHKAILSARSPAFSRIMKNAKDNDYVVDITDVSPQVLEEIISFSYTGKMKTYKSLFSMELYKGAKTYMETLATRCSTNLLYTVDEKSLCDVIIFAHKHDERLLFSRCLMYLKMISDKILYSEEWQNLIEKDENLAYEIFRWLEEPTDKSLSLTDLF